MILATIGPFAVGTVLAWTSPVLPVLEAQQNATNLADNVGPTITAEEGSWVGSIIAIGAVFGSLPASWGADFIGRKPAIALLAIPFLLSWVMIIVAKSVFMLYVARFIAGAVIGAVTATIPMYIGEIAETSVRGWYIPEPDINVVWITGFSRITARSSSSNENERGSVRSVVLEGIGDKLDIRVLKHPSVSA